MEEFQDFIANAERNIAIAEHLLKVSYPALQDPKVLLSVCENLFLGFSNAFSAAVYYERRFKRIPPFVETFSGRLDTFAKRIVPRYKLKKEYLALIEELRDLVLKHEQSPVEFRRKQTMVICDDDYGHETLTAERLMRYLKEAQQFYHQIAEITGKHANIFKRQAL